MRPPTNTCSLEYRCTLLVASNRRDSNGLEAKAQLQKAESNSEEADTLLQKAWVGALQLQASTCTSMFVKLKGKPCLQKSLPVQEVAHTSPMRAVTKTSTEHHDVYYSQVPSTGAS